MSDILTECPCTTIEQDEDCPVGYPSLLCGACKGTGYTAPETVTALAAEMLRIASDIGEPEDPFAAWESIDLIKSQNDQLRAERNGLRYKVTAAALSDQQLAEEMAEMQRAFSNRGEGSGSPGEWSYERMEEIATEQQRRAARKTSGTGGEP